MQRHGLSIGIERVDNQILLMLRAIGTLTHSDYQRITPMIEAAIGEVEQPSIRALIDGTELDGWEPRAAWDDLRLGLKHGREFSRIAIVGNKRWQKLAAKISGWFISGESRYFESFDEGLAWLMEA